MFYDFYSRRERTGIGQAFGNRLYRHYAGLLGATHAFEGPVLEIGPGEGQFAEQCREAGHAYAAIERSPAMRAKLAARGFDVVAGSAPPIEFDDHRFGTVAALAVLEHMPDFERAIQLMQECFRVLRPGGVIGVAVPDYVRCGIDFYNWDYTHGFVTTRRRVEGLLQDVGFEQVRSYSLSGSFRSRLVRLPADVLGMAIHSRPAYWLLGSVGLESWLFRFHKTFQPITFLVARRPPT